MCETLGLLILPFPSQSGPLVAAEERLSSLSVLLFTFFVSGLLVAAVGVLVLTHCVDVSPI